jgi:hypothetical protein
VAGAGWLVGVVLGVVMFGGLREKVTESTKFSENRTLVSAPRSFPHAQGDAAALKASEDRLTEVRYGVLEKKGPKAAWEGWLGDKKKR